MNDSAPTRVLACAGLLSLFAIPGLAQNDADFDALFASEGPPAATRPSQTPSAKEPSPPSDKAEGSAAAASEQSETREPDAQTAESPAEVQDTVELPQPPPAVAPPQTSRRGIDEIVVTATKRERSVRDIAASVSALSGQMIEDAGMQDIGQIIEAVPGINMVDDQSSNSPRRITIRGISAGPGTVDTVGIFIDETPFSDTFRSFITLDANPFDMASVEVLKGPVGTLFGGSSLNGAVRYIPQGPIFGEWETKAYAEMRSFAEGGIAPAFGLAMNIPLFEREDLALRLLGTNVHTAGYVDSVNQNYPAIDVNEIEQQSYRAMLSWKPAEVLDLSLMYIKQENLVKDAGVSTANRGGKYESTANPQASPIQTTYEQYQFKADYGLPFADLVFVYSSADKGLDALIDISHVQSEDPQTSTTSQELESFPSPRSQELRLVSSGDGRWDWLVGLFNYKYVLGTNGRFNYSEAAQNPAFAGSAAALELAGQAEFVESAYDANGPVVLYFEHRGDVTEQAVFSEVNWRINDTFELTTGLRLYRFKYNVMLRFDGAVCAATDPSCLANNLRSDQLLRSTEQGVSPKLSLKWDALDNVMAYATISRGFRFGGLNDLPHPEIPTAFESDSLWNYELGMRSQWLNNTLIADLAVYMIEWDNAQFSTQTSDGLFTYTDNVGAVEGLGAESQLIWYPPLKGVNLIMTIANADIATSESFNSGAPFAATVPAGQEWPRSPRWQTAMTLGWTGQFGRGIFNASLNHNYSALTKQNFGFSPEEEIFGYATYGLQLSLKQPDGRGLPDVILNVNNLTDKRGINFLSNFSPSGLRGYAPPRNVSLRLTYQF